VSKKDQLDATIADLEAKLPGLCGSKDAVLDICFANAGIGKGGLWALQDFQDHLDVCNVNFIGVMQTIYSSLKLMKGNAGALVFSTSSSSAMWV
jgi:NAD(P)-dependent dehydrogenase (short-subunit alcohol dehydrogenase family)